MDYMEKALEQRALAAQERENVQRQREVVEGGAESGGAEREVEQARLAQMEEWLVRREALADELEAMADEDAVWRQDFEQVQQSRLISPEEPTYASTIAPAMVTSAITVEERAREHEGKALELKAQAAVTVDDSMRDQLVAQLTEASASAEACNARRDYYLLSAHVALEPLSVSDAKEMADPREVARREATELAFRELAGSVSSAEEREKARSAGMPEPAPLSLEERGAEEWRLTQLKEGLKRQHDQRWLEDLEDLTHGGRDDREAE